MTNEETVRGARRQGRLSSEAIELAVSFSRPTCPRQSGPEEAVRRAKEHFEFAASLTTKKSESPGTPNARMASWRETQARVKAEMGLAPRSGGVDESIQADWRAAHERAKARWPGVGGND